MAIEDFKYVEVDFCETSLDCVASFTFMHGFILGVLLSHSLYCLTTSSFFPCRQNGVLLLAVSLLWSLSWEAEVMMLLAIVHIAFAGM